MYKCLDTYLKAQQEYIFELWQPKKPKLLIQLDNFEGEQTKIPQAIQKVYVPPKERGKPEKEKKPEYTEPLETIDPTWRLWQELDPIFMVGRLEDGEALTESNVKIRIGEWTQRGFTRLECKEWMKAGIGAGEAHIASYCRDILAIEPEDIITHYGYDDIIKMYNEHFKKDEDDEEVERDTEN